MQLTRQYSNQRTDMQRFTLEEQAAAAQVLDLYGGDRSRWTKGANAREPMVLRWQNAVRANDERAVCWCIMGACVKLEIRPGLLEDALGKALNCGDAGFSMVEWNDQPHRRFDEVEDRLKEIAGLL